MTSAELMHFNFFFPIIFEIAKANSSIEVIAELFFSTEKLFKIGKNNLVLKTFSYPINIFINIFSDRKRLHFWPAIQLTYDNEPNHKPKMDTRG